MPLERDIQNVLPSFRTTKRDLWRWDAVSDYSSEADNGVALLRDVAEDYGAAGVIPAVRKAIASTFRVLMRADDSNGEIQSVIADLLDLHTELCAEAPPAPASLADWIIKTQFSELGEYFSVDVLDYEEALGARGIAAIETRLDKRRAALTTPFDGRPDREFTHDDERSDRRSLLYVLQRLAVLRSDEEAIVQAYGGDMPHAYRRADAAKALREAGLLDRAAQVAHEGMDLPGGAHQQQECGEIWAELLASQHPDQAPDAAEEVFTRWPNARNARAWLTAAGVEVRERAIARLRTRAWELIAFLVGDGDIARAWAEAMDAADRGDRLHVEQWDDLVDRYAKIDPVAVLPVMAQLIDDRLVEANTRVYPGAVKRMRALRKAALAAGRPEFAARYLADLRQKYGRRPSLIKRMDAAGL